MGILPFRLLGRRALVALAALCLFARAAGAAELNALVWCDHADPNLLKPFEEASGVKVNLKEFEGTGAGFAIIDQSQPGDWDVMVIDSIDVPRGVEKGLFAPLPEDQLPLADVYPEVKMDDTTKVDGKRYGMTEKFGYNTIGFNKDKVEPADMQSLPPLTDPKYKGRIAIYDYYLPVIGMAALAHRQEDRRTDRGRSAGDQGCPPEDEGQCQAGRRGDGQPDGARHRRGRHSGGRRRMGDRRVSPRRTRRSISRSRRRAASCGRSRSPCSRLSKNKDLALKFIQYVLSPRVRRGLPPRPAIGACRPTARRALTDEQKKPCASPSSPTSWRARSPIRRPTPTLDKKMQDVWTEMLQAQ